MKYLLFLFAVLFSAASCKTKDKPVSREEAAAFAKSVEKSIAARNHTFLSTAFDTDALIARMKAATPGETAGFWKDVKQGMGERMKFGNRIIQALNSKGTYQLVKQYQQGDKQHLLFRLFADGSVNYHDFELVNKAGTVKIADVYIYLGGELFSKTLTDIFTEILKAENANEGAAVELRKLHTLMQQEKYDDAREVLDRLPENLKNTKAIQLKTLELLIETDTARYATAAEKFRTDFPDDPSINLALLNGMIVMGKYTDALACINSLDRQINKDPLLDYYRGMLYNLKGEKETAMQTFETLYKNMPEFSPVLWSFQPIIWTKAILNRLQLSSTKQETTATMTRVLRRTWN